ncbi:hypothetical protein F0L68_14520 [Solihabitans fulvus]|uniref:Uncharacterized protein n=1 Tax=Solihabitans fulvus TaxID=1892852 RepID=A0A5B2XGL0_9PSEU|nr:hypothetical protein F0L68_14520 [Solihabitans fulvus]
MRSVDLSFIWTRGDGFQYVTRGFWREGHTMTRLDIGKIGNIVDRPATRTAAWVDDVDIYREMNGWLAANRPDWYKDNGPLRPGPDGNPTLRWYQPPPPMTTLEFVGRR